MKITTAFILIILSVLFALPVQAQAQPGAYKPGKAPYWDDQMTAVPYDPDSGLYALPLLDSVINRYEFFFMGEEHWKTINTQLQLSFLLYLHQNAGVRNLVVEGGYSFGFLINQYLESGDEGILRKALTNIPVCPEDQRAMYRRLYAYNQALPQADRISVTGIDVEHSPELALQVLYSLRPAGEEPPRRIQRRIEQLTELHESYYIVKSDVKRFFKRFSRSLKQRGEEHRQYWGDDYARVALLAENTMAGYDFKMIKAMIFENTWQDREAQMFRNFVALQPYMAPGGFFAQFGVLHTDLYQSSQWEFPTLAQRLNRLQESPVTDQVLTISRYVRQMDDRYETLGKGEPLLRLVHHAERSYPGQVVLCNLMGPQSPFPNLSRNFQYLILIDEELEESACD